MIRTALGFRLLKEVSRILPRVGNACNEGNSYLISRRYTTHRACLVYSNRHAVKSFHTRRYSTLPEVLHEPLDDAEFLSFIQSTLDEQEGSSHLWLNKPNTRKSPFKKDGIFLVVAGKFIGDSLDSSCGHLISLQKVKSLQQRYPSLQIIGFQYDTSASRSAVHNHLLWRIMAEYITFPILVSNKSHKQIKEGGCYFLFEDFQNTAIYQEKDVDFATIEKAVRTITSDQTQRSRLKNPLDSPWANPIQAVKEPYHCLSLRNLFLYFPGCISVDEDGKRLFLSDSNHHRIIILDTNAKILDAIGSSPGFEDSEFENAKLMRPAASFYDSLEDCLYFVDSENHAIRRAVMEKRVVETIYPFTPKKETNLWSWVKDKFWKKKIVDVKSDEFHSDSLLFPWHILKSSSNDLFILNQSFDTLWILDLASGVLKQVKGLPSILESCGELIMEKSSVLKHIPNDWLHKQMGTMFSLGEIPQAGLMSSVARLRDDIIFCDTVDQMVLKLNGESGIISNFHFSNFGNLGLPYWFSFPLERVCADDDIFSEMHIDHVEGFSLKPGKVSILVKVIIPEGMDLVEPLSRSSLWCQARGTAMEISGVDEAKVDFSEKVGVAQQWYDEIDYLTFTTSDKESSSRVETTSPNKEMQEGRACFNCNIATSPGTSQVFIYAPLYLRLKKNPDWKNETEKAERIVNILDLKKRPTRDSVIQFLLASERDLEEHIFLKSLHLRLNFATGPHPKADNSKGVILTDSSVEVNVAL